jgi:molecular chaperone DnaK (HSP70)
MNKNKKKVNLFSGYKIILKDIKIENGSSIAALCLFNNKIKFKNNIENIFNDNNDNNNDGPNNNNISETNKDYFSKTPKNIDNKERDSINYLNKNKNILIINIDGGFTNISLANISQNKQKEKNSNKIKYNKNIKKINLNILEIKELSGNEFGEEDLIDIYINDCLKQFDETIYKDCLKSPNELARLRQSVLIAKKYFNSSQKDNSISISLPHNFLDLKIILNQNDYEKSCQEIFTKIMAIIKNILKKAKLTEKNIDLITLIASKVTKNKIFSMIKNIFTNSKIIYNNCSDYIVTGATMQALNNNMIKPFYKFIDITNMNFGIETLNGIMDIIVPKGLKLPIQKIKYVKIKNNDNNDGENNHLNKYLEINIFEGDNKFVKNNRLISCANIDKRNFKEEKIGEGYIELLVECEINNYSSLSVYVLDIKNFKRRFECLTNLDMVKG